MKAGNKSYNSVADLSGTIGLFPLSGALLLPGGNMPLNVFEPRYLALIDDNLKAARLIGMIQPCFDQEQKNDHPDLCEIGCLGRITAFRETGDGRYVMNLSGVCRFRLMEELPRKNEYRRGRIAAFGEDLEDNSDAESEVNRDELLATFKAFLDANNMEADWEGVSSASTETLVNSLSMMSPYGPAEKQALLEAPDLKTRAETLVAMTEIMLARESGDASSSLQ